MATKPTAEKPDDTAQENGSEVAPESTVNHIPTYNQETGAFE